MSKTKKANGGLFLSMLMILIFATFLSGCASAPHIEKITVPNNFKQVVPISNIAGKWILPVSINDIELSLMLDTGSTQIALFENNRTRVFFDNVDSYTETRAFDRSGPSVKSKFMKNATLRMNGFPNQNVSVALFEPDQNPVFMYKIDGLIGFPLLSKYDVQIDNQKQLATFMKAGTLTRSNAKHYFPIKLIGKIPAFEGKLRFPYAENAEKLPVTVDTGANMSILVFTSDDVNASANTPVKETYVKTISGLEEYTKIDGVEITATDGVFSLKATATVKTIANIKTRASIGMPTLSEDIVEISYKSGYISAGDNPNSPP